MIRPTPATLRTFTVTAAILVATQAPAGLPTDAIGAIAVSPDGSTVIASGNPRTFYVVDAQTLTVKERVWHGYSPNSLTWSKDGKTLAMLHTDDVVTFFDAATLKETTSTDRFNAHCFAVKADKLVTATNGSKQDDKVPITLAVYSLATGAKTAETEISYTIEASALACSPDGTEIVLASRDYDAKNEERKDPPQDIESEKRAEFVKRNDAKAMWIGWFDGAMKKGPEYESWFSGSSPELFYVRDGKAFWFDNSSDNGVFAADGSVTMQKLENAGSFYGKLASPDHDFFLSGTLGKGFKVDGTTFAETRFDFADALKGWPEYLYGFAIAGDGTIYGGTSAYRMMKISSDGKVLDMKPVN